MSKTVAFIHGVSPIGGAERELLRFLDRLPQSGYRPIVICPWTGPLAEAVRHRGIGLYHCEFPPWRKVSSLFRRRSSAEELRQALRASSPDLIHVNDIWWVPQTLRAAGAASLPVIAHVRQEIEPSKVPRYELDRVDQVVTVSRHIEEAVRSAGVRGQVKTLYSGLECAEAGSVPDPGEVRRRYSIPADAPLLGTVANLFPRKGFHVMIDALAIVAKRHPEIRYLIVGSGDDGYERAVREQVKKLGLADRVHFAGFQSEVAPYLSAMDLYVQPSLMEGFGIAVVEAMAMGKAVVGTRTGGLPEVIVDQDTGLLVPPENAPALAEAIDMLLNDSGRRERFGRAGRIRAITHFSIEAMMRGLTSIYEEQIARHTRSGAAEVS